MTKPKPQQLPGGMHLVRQYPEPETMARGLSLMSDGHFEDASVIFQRLDAIYDRHYPARVYGALVHWKRTSANAEFVLEVLMEGARAMPKWWVPAYNVGVMLDGLGRTTEAEPWIEKAVRLMPSSYASWGNLGNIRLGQGRVQEAMSCYERCLALSSGDDGLARYNMSQALGYLGKWEECYTQYEYRWTSKEQLRDFGLPRITPAWDGVTHVPHLITSDEQGIGDVIQFARFLPMLRAYCDRLTCVVRHAALRPLLVHNFPDVHFIAETDEVPEADAHVPLLSCVSRLRITEERLDGGRYLEEPDAMLRGFVIDGQSTVGICWAGSESHKRDGTRSIPFDIMRPLLDLPGITWVNLVFNSRGGVSHPSLLDLRDECPTFMESSALVAALDAVVTVDTSTLHLAGALGVPTIGLIAAAPDFRWMLDRTDTPWYDSVRLVRQQKHGEWAPAITEAKDLLSSMLHHTASVSPCDTM